MLELFRDPPPEYGEVSFFWWHGDPITQEKLSWILAQLKDKHICGLQINYCHGDSGGQLYGLTMPSTPAPFSEEWWKLLEWFVPACKKLGMAVSLSDYTLGAPGQGCYMDTVLQKHPEFTGQRLVYENGEVTVETVPYSANPMVKGIGEAIADEFYGAFERHFPGECGKAINYFFSDELRFNIRGNLWCDDFASEFLARKGYDIVPLRKAIFVDIGPETPKIRLDYYDVIVQLSEEGYFKPIYDWHQARGMTFGCDHGGRGGDVTEFGDYFRTMKWYQGPGNDQPKLASSVIKSKVSASIAHLYNRPRVWLEGYYSSGWQTSSADVADATFRNFALGHNLLSLHGLYYSTHGSMWEWAPPCNHHHMPYWQEMGSFLACTQRMSWLLAQGVHRCDVAIVYPVAAMEADIEQGNAAVAAAFETARYLYAEGIDFDFIDFESIERAEIDHQKLCVAGEEYRAVVVPNMRAVRYGMMEQLEKFSQAGGIVTFLGELPRESEHAGRDDEALAALVEKTLQKGHRVTAPQELPAILDAGYPRDFWTEASEPFVLHRIFEGKDLYFVYKLPQGSLCRFRATGTPLRLNPWTGTAERITDYQTLPDGMTELRTMLPQTEPLLLLFEKDAARAAEYPVFCDTYEKTIQVSGEWRATIQPTMDNRYGDYRLPAHPGCLGPEARVFRYCVTPQDCSAPTLDDSAWPETTCSYATYFWLGENLTLPEEALANLEAPTKAFVPYRFSLQWGIEGDAGNQGSYHGLKCKLSDDFIALGQKKITHAGSGSVYENDAVRYLFTNVYSETDQQATISVGALAPDRIWINHQPVSGKTVPLVKGLNTILLKYSKAGRTHFALLKDDAFRQTIPLVTRWYQNPCLLPFVARPLDEGESCWYRFTSPPGMRRLKLSAGADAKVFAEGVAMKREGDWFSAPAPLPRAAKIAVQLRLKAGRCEGAALEKPVEFACEEGLFDTEKSWDEQGLRYYSGGLRLEKTISLPTVPSSVLLEIPPIGCAMEVTVNGKTAATLLVPPYRCRVEPYLTPGENTITILVHNTMQNHMRTIPTNFNELPRNF